MLTVLEHCENGEQISEGALVVVLSWEELVPIIKERFPHWITLTDHSLCAVNKDVYDALHARGPIPMRVSDSGLVSFDRCEWTIPKNAMVYAEEYAEEYIPEPSMVVPGDASGLFAWLEA